MVTLNLPTGNFLQLQRNMKKSKMKWIKAEAECKLMYERHRSEMHTKPGGNVKSFNVCARLTVKNRLLRGETLLSQSADVKYEGQRERLGTPALPPPLTTLLHLGPGIIRNAL